MLPRSIAQASSPSAISIGRTGVARIPSYSFMYFIFPKKLNVVSESAPVMADAASIAGATNAEYGTTRPSGNVSVPISRPTPTPIENRYMTGSRNPVAITTQYAERRAVRLRSTTDDDRRPAPSNEISRGSTNVTMAIASLSSAILELWLEQTGREYA